MIRGLHHICLVTDHFDRLVSFYCDTIGGELALETSFEPGNTQIDELTSLTGVSMNIVLVRLGNAYIEIQEYLAPPGPEGDPDRPPHQRGVSHFGIDVVDLPREYERLAAAGVPFLSPPQHMGGLVINALGRDPDGNLIEFQELLDPTLPVLLPGLPPPGAGGQSA